MNSEDTTASQAAAPTAQPLSLAELDPEAASVGAALTETPGELTNPLRNVRVRLTVSLGTAELTVGELLGAKAQQVLRLDRGIEQPVDVLLEGHVVARGVLVAVDDQFGVRITELPISLDLPLGTTRPGAEPRAR